MPQNVLLHFPIVDLACLQQSVHEHTQRVVKLIRKHNEYITKCKISTSDKESTLFPLYSSEIPIELSNSENNSLSEDDIFSAVTGSNLNENDCTVRSDVIDENRGKTLCILNRARSSDLNSFYREISSDTQWRNIEQDSGNLTTLSCPIRFPSEEKQIPLRVPGFEAFLTASKPSSHNSKNSEKKYSEYLRELGNNSRKIESLPSSTIKSVKKEQCEIKMEQRPNPQEADDDVVIIEVKKERKIEVITLDDEEDNRAPQAAPSTRPVSAVPKPPRPAVVVSEPVRGPLENSTPPSLTREVSDPPCLLPEIMEPMLASESSKPPLIFPEIDPPLWSHSLSRSMISFKNAQPPILTPEVKDLILISDSDGVVYQISDESQPPLMSSEVLPPMLMNPETSGNAYINLGDSESSQESVTIMDAEESVTVMNIQESVSVMDAEESVTFMDIQESVTIMDAQESVTVMDAEEEPMLPVVTSVRSLRDLPYESISDMTSLDESEYQIFYTETIEEVEEEPQEEPQQQAVITPKKTNDITKIKGWKRKHFRVDTDETNEPDEQPKAKRARNEKAKKEKAKKETTKKETTKKETTKKGKTKKETTKKGKAKKETTKKGKAKKEKAKKEEETKKLEDERPAIVVIDIVDNEPTEEVNQNNAFVCDRLDKFLEGEASLKKNCEVPHLFAEVGITLTKEDVVSKPEVSEEEYRQVVTRYCVKLKMDDVNGFNALNGLNDLNDVDNDKDNEDETLKPDPKEKKGAKKKSNENSKSSKAGKSDPSNKKEKQTSKKKKNSTSAKKKGAAQTASQKPKPKPKKTKVTNQNQIATSSEIQLTDLNDTGSDEQGPTKLIGLALYPGPKAPLPLLVQRHLDKIRSYQLKIDRSWANFAASALVQPEGVSTYSRMILPVEYNAESLSRIKQSTTVPNEVNQAVEKLVDTACEEPPQQSTKDLARDKPKKTYSKKKAESEEPKAKNNQPKPKTTKQQPKTTKQQQKKTKQQPKATKQQPKATKQQPKTTKKNAKRDSKITECKIIVSKADEPTEVWCTKHNRYCCQPCGLNHDRQEERTTQPTEADFPTEFFVMSTPLKTNREIANFLTNQLHNAEWKDVILNNIDKLRSIVPNALEFINLSIVRDNFLSKHIYIWYTKPDPKVWHQSRAYLTFSKDPPMPSAVRFKTESQNFEEAVPKVIMDMMTITERNAGSDREYAIMLCNENAWELHGSLRYATHNQNSENLEKDCLKREEFLIPSYLSELEKISEAANKVIKKPSFRWWVVDLTQKFTTIVSNLDSQTNIMTKQDILNHLKTKYFGFLLLNKTSNRVIWIHAFPKTLPYVLIGPFNLSEPHGLTLKQGPNEVPFSYYPKSCASPKFPLKTLLNSVITQTIEQDRELKGLWLCQRQQVDKACYLETLTSLGETSSPMLEYNLDVEHCYTLKSLVNNQTLTVKRNVCQIVPKVKVYLYFDVFELGYITGNLFQDDTVMTGNPLNKRIVTVPSYAFGNWFICLLKEKIRFVPNTIKLKWYVTKHEEDLKGRKPFDLGYLNGSYMICGIGHSLELLDMKAGSGDFNNDKEIEKELVKEIESEIKWERQREKEIEKERKRMRKAAETAHLRRLEYALYGTTNGKMSPDKIMTKAEKVIEELETLKYISSLILGVVSSNRTGLGAKFIETLDSVDLDDAAKIELFRSAKKLFVKKDSDELEPVYKEILLRHKFGRLYLILNGERELLNADYKPPKKQIEYTNDAGRTNKSVQELADWFTEVALQLRSDLRRTEDSEPTEAANENGQETTTTSSGSLGQTPVMEKSIKLKGRVRLISTLGRSNIGKDNNTHSFNSLGVNTEASTQNKGGRQPKEEKRYAFIPTMVNLKNVLAQIQRNSSSEIIPIIRMTEKLLEQQHPNLTLKAILEHPNGETHGTDCVKLSDSLLIHPHLGKIVQEKIAKAQREVDIEIEVNVDEIGDDVDEDEEIDVVNDIEVDGFSRGFTGEGLVEPEKKKIKKTAAEILIQGVGLRQGQVIYSGTFTMTSITSLTSTDILNDPQDNEDYESNVVTIFDSELGLFFKMAIDE